MCNNTAGMPRSRRQDSSKVADQIAREAARLLAAGRAADLDEARRLATYAMNDRTGSAAARGGRGRPSNQRIRQHAQAMDMQAMGEAAYRGQIRSWLELAEDLMSTIQTAIPDSETLLVGRAAEGHFDGDPELRFRILTTVEIGEIARALAEFGYAAPDATFPTLDTVGGADSGGGRLSQMQWRDEGGVRITLTRCPQRSQFETRVNLATGEPVSRLTRIQLQNLLASPSPADGRNR